MASDGKKAITIGAILVGIAGIFVITRKVKAEVLPGNIVLSNLIIEPSEVFVGEPVNISVIATNIGGEQATKQVVLEVL